VVPRAAFGLICGLSGLLACSAPAQAPDGHLAFPTAAGFGATAVGGRGGKVLAVTNLNDRGPGSLRAALTASGPRTVVFRQGGTIRLGTPIEVTEPYLTIAGQTRPAAASPCATIRTTPSRR
jgi:hypothetical protein